MPQKRKAGRQSGAISKPVYQPDVAAQVKSSPRPQESTFRRQLKLASFRLILILGIVFVTRRLNSDAKTFQDKLLPYRVTDLPGRGKGLIATRLIKQGERIITERPLFVVPSQTSEDPVALINSRLNALLPPQQAAFRELSYVDSDSDIPPEKVPLSIFQTNGIAAGQSEVGIFPRTARLNHACSAGFNSVYSWRDNEKQLVVHALKEVQPGEELLTAYFNTKMPRDERRDHLANVYKFNCSCKVCSLPADESLASDRRLQYMTELYAKFATWTKYEIDGVEALELARKIWRTGEEEGYWSERGQLAADAAHVAAAHSDEHGTQQWAALSQEWYGYEVGKDSEQVEQMRIIVDDPRLHAAWNTRNRLKVGGHGL